MKEAEGEDEVPVASDRGWSWVALTAAVTNALLLAGYMKGIGVLFVEWQESFGVTAKDVGWTGVIIGFCVSIGALMAGALASRFTCQKIIICFGMIFAASVASSSFCSDMWQLYVTNCIAGLSLGMCIQPSWTSVGYNFHKWLGVANGIASSGVGMGIVALPPIIQFFCNMLGWRGALQVTGAILLLCSVCGLFIRPTEKELFLLRRRENTKNRKEEERIKRCSVVSQNGVVIIQESACEKCIRLINTFIENLGLKLLLESPRFFVVCLANGLVGFSYYAGLVFFQSKVVYDNHIPKQQASYLTSAIGVGSIIGRVASGVLIDFNVLSARFLYGMANLFCSFFGFANPFVSSYSMLIVIAVWFGMFSGLSYSMAIYCARLYVVADKISTSIGVVLLTEGIGVLFGVFFMGLVRDLTTNYDLSFILCGASFVTSALVIVIDSIYLEYKGRRGMDIPPEGDVDCKEVVTIKPEDGTERKRKTGIVEENGKTNLAFQKGEENDEQCVISIVNNLGKEPSTSGRLHR